MKKLFVLLTLVSLLGCDEEKHYNTGHFPEITVNFEAVNSPYDDYNSTAPFIYYRYLFHFSSNRNSAGNDFDIVGENMFINWDKIDGTLEVGTNYHDDRYDYLVPMLDSVNKGCDELGPYSLGYRQDLSYTEVLWTDLMMYAENCNGNFDIRYIYGGLYNNVDTVYSTISESHDISFLNSEANDLYPTFFGDDFYYYDEWGVEPAKIQEMIFCSDRGGRFDLYRIPLNVDSSLVDALAAPNPYDTEKLSISGVADDKCPFVNGKLMVFTSNRPGGYGGYDLYYSRFDNGQWTEPRNFGEDINTPYDEYRPITLFYHDFDNLLMIFSSNRPGGLGGYDLYYTGIDMKVM